MKLVKQSWFPSSAVIVCGFASLTLPQMSPPAWSATQTEIIQRCESCHGARGDSQVTSTPRLNGQRSEYIADRLKTFSKVAATSPHAQAEMLKALAAASDADRVAIATYFARQTPTSPKPGARADEGRRIYENGSTTENVISCNQCHGARGEGHDGTPRLAGQHADYLMAQLHLFNLKFREHVLMDPNTKAMTEKTMGALASYLANN